MTTIALVHPKHGTHFVYDKGAVEEMKKQGWSVRSDDWKEKAKAEADAKRREAMRAEMARLAAELGEPVEMQESRVVTPVTSEPAVTTLTVAPEVKPKRKYTRRAA